MDKEHKNNNPLYDNGYLDGMMNAYQKLSEQIKELENRQYEDKEIYRHLKNEVLFNYIKDGKNITNTKLK